MNIKSTPAKITEAIKESDLVLLGLLFREHPDQFKWNTPFAGQTWLGYAAGLGKFEVVEFLVSIGFDVNLGDHREDVKPISRAANNDHFEIVKYLLEVGSETPIDFSVRNPLFAAIVGRSPEIVRLLLNHGIDSTIHYNSSTMKNMDSIAFALMRGEKECAEIIAEWQATSSGKNTKELLAEADEIAHINAHGK